MARGGLNYWALFLRLLAEIQPGLRWLALKHVLHIHTQLLIARCNGPFSTPRVPQRRIICAEAHFVDENTEVHTDMCNKWNVNAWTRSSQTFLSCLEAVKSGACDMVSYVSLLHAPPPLLFCCDSVGIWLLQRCVCVCVCVHGGFLASLIRRQITRLLPVMKAGTVKETTWVSDLVTIRGSLTNCTLRMPIARSVCVCVCVCVCECMCSLQTLPFSLSTSPRFFCGF